LYFWVIFWVIFLIIECQTSCNTSEGTHLYPRALGDSNPQVAPTPGSMRFLGDRALNTIYFGMRRFLGHTCVTEDKSPDLAVTDPRGNSRPYGKKEWKWQTRVHGLCRACNGLKVGIPNVGVAPRFFFGVNGNIATTNQQTHTSQSGKRGCTHCSQQGSMDCAQRAMS
jgi:hypothetical protein